MYKHSADDQQEILENPTWVRPSIKMQNISRDLSVIEHERTTDVVSDSSLLLACASLPLVESWLSIKGQYSHSYEKTIFPTHAYMRSGVFHKLQTSKSRKVD